MLVEENESDIAIIYLRPTMIYGYLNDRNMIIFIKMVDKLRLFPIINHGNNLRRAYYQVLINKDIRNGDYILSGEKPIKMIDMFKLISNILGKKIIFISVPLNIGILMAKILKIITIDKVDFIERVQLMGEDRSFSYKKAKIDFGYEPMKFEHGLRVEVEEYLNSKNKKNN